MNQQQLNQVVYQLSLQNSSGATDGSIRRALYEVNGDVPALPSQGKNESLSELFKQEEK